MTFKIWAPKGILFAANHLCDQLSLLGHSSCVVDSIIPGDDSMYILYAACSLKRLPKNYIVYQTEVASSAWFTPRYLEIISNAVCVWEYSDSNIHKYSKVNDKICIVSPGVSKMPPPNKDGTVLFYGWIAGSQRRHEILRQLRRRVQINVVYDKTESEMWALLSRASVVVNLHYYENAPLEQFRINEALSFGCHVISEKSISGDEKYSGLVTFSETEYMPRVISMLLNSRNKPDISKLDNSEEIKAGIELFTCNLNKIQS